MKIVITGGCGFLGVGIARKLMTHPGIDSLVLEELPGVF
jgi:nucleoside-diphosphate-sugar epimerase